MVNILRNGGDEKDYRQALKQLSQVPETIENIDYENNEELHVPETIKEIFEVSNRNRKKNKMRKKDNAVPESPQKPQAIFDIIQNQYKIDEKENGFVDFKAVVKMGDQDFLAHLGLTDKQQLSHSPLIKKQFKPFPKCNGFVAKTPNPYG